MSTQNPLLQHFHTHFETPPFSQIKLEHYAPALDEAIALSRKNIEAIRNNLEAPSFQNTIMALEQADEPVAKVADIFFNLLSAEGDAGMQKLAPELSQKLSQFSSDISLDEKIFARVKLLWDHREGESYPKEEARLLEKTYKGFIRNGALLNNDQKEQLRKIDDELSVLSPKFAENVLKATHAFQMWVENKEDLAGLPESAVEAAAMLAEEKGQAGKWLFTLDAPSYLAFMTYADRRDLREKMYHAYTGRAFGGEFDNRENLKRTAVLRMKRAQLLGYKTHAHFVLEERMAENADRVMKFLTRLYDVSFPKAKQELKEVQKFAAEHGLKGDLQPWDWAYYSEKLKKVKFDFDEEELRPYFSLEKVVQGAFLHAEKLYGLKFRAVEGVPAYHPDVRVYEVLDRNDQHLSVFYTDFFPRANKRGGAWMTSFREQGMWSGILKRPLVSIVCNFTKPTPTKPSLLTYDEVTTLFHEFGHALHGMLSRCQHRSLSGTNVPWDFVELPSQIMENWVKEKESLDLFAKHFETGEAIPQSLCDKIKKAATFQAAYANIRQLRFAWLDMQWHTLESEAQIKSVEEFETNAIEKFELFGNQKGINVSCAFSHIFAGGYSAGYYSYKWAEVLDADAFEYFVQEGLFNKEVAARFEENVLSRGGSEPPMDLYKRFRGREPDPDALLRRDGLLN